jgi:hypothetical protein
VAAEEKGRAARAARVTNGPKLNFKLELSCGCKPPICPHAGPGIAKLLSAAYAKGRADGARAAGATGARASAGANEPATIRVKQKGSTRAQ